MISPDKGIGKWIEDRLPVFEFAKHSLVDYPTPRNLNYWWNFGSLAGITLVIMIVTGIVLAMQYTPHVDHAFNSVERIMRDVNYGWLLRYLHMNGATMFFIVVYIHIFRGLYYGSYKAPRELLWWLGVIILLLMMATAFMGYVLPWGQMSFWGTTVITNLFSAVPLVGEDIVTWLWGGFAVGNPTLNRFFALHYLLPFVIVGVVVVHIWALHTVKSNNPLGIDMKGPQDSIPFHPYYTAKDYFGLGVFFIVYLGFVFFAPNFFGEPDNYIPANPMATPPHIVPEWYFLPFYAILRAIPDKLGGVVAMFGSILILFVLPWLDRSKVRSARFRPIYKQFFWIFLIDCFVLGWVGANPPEGMFITIGRVATAYYFAHFLVILPLLGLVEKTKPLPESIAAAVTNAGSPKDNAMRKTHILFCVAIGFGLLLGGPQPVVAAGGAEYEHHEWTFDGIFGRFDRAALRRGHQVYQEVCSGCHGLKLIAYRNLMDIGFSEEEAKEIAAEATVMDGPDEEGEMFERDGKLSDRFVSPFPNEQAARYSNNGALPPDLSLMVKARKGGADYVYGILTGYVDEPPEDVELMDGMYYNHTFPGHQIAMPPPLYEDGVEYEDGTPASVEQMAKDIATFLAWTAEPELEARKSLGIKVLLFVILLTAMLYAVKRRVWSKLH